MSGKWQPLTSIKHPFVTAGFWFLPDITVGNRAWHYLKLDPSDKDNHDLIVRHWSHAMPCHPITSTGKKPCSRSDCDFQRFDGSTPRGWVLLGVQMHIKRTCHLLCEPRTGLDIAFQSFGTGNAKMGVHINHRPLADCAYQRQATPFWERPSAPSLDPTTELPPRRFDEAGCPAEIQAVPQHWRSRPVVCNGEILND